MWSSFKDVENPYLKTEVFLSTLPHLHPNLLFCYSCTQGIKFVATILCFAKRENNVKT